MPPLGSSPSYLVRVLPLSLKPLVLDGSLSPKDCFLLSELSFHVLIGLKSNTPSRADHYKDLTRDFLYALLTKTYRATLENLMNTEGGGLIEVCLNEEGKESYSTLHNSSKQYRLVPRLREELKKGQIYHHLITDKLQLKRHNRWREKCNNALYDKYPWLQEEMSKYSLLSYDTHGSQRFIDDAYDRLEFRGKHLTSSQYHFLKHHHQELDKSINHFKSASRVSYKHGRVFHPLAHCNREFRYFVRTHEGESFAEVDLNAAQFAFLAQLLGIVYLYNIEENYYEQFLTHLGEPIDLCTIAQRDGLIERQLGAYFNTVFNSDLYTELGVLQNSDHYSINSTHVLEKNERDAVKQAAIADLLYAYDSNSKVEHADFENDHGVNGALFRNYPLVLKLLQNIKQESPPKKRSSQLAILLQSAEGYFFHRVLAPAVKEQFPTLPFFVVHDAIYVPASKREEMQALAARTLEKHLGWPGRWKTSDLRPPTPLR